MIDQHTILYFGSYKDKSDLGLLSSFILKDLTRLSNVITENVPIYIDDANMGVDYKLNVTKAVYDFDTVIQHAPLNYIVSDDKIKRNIIFPIFGYINEEVISKLQSICFDKILVDNKYHLDHLKKYFSKKVIHYKYYTSDSTANRRYNLGFYNHTKKFYAFVSYELEKYIIDKIILSFLLAFRDCSSTSLLMFVSSKKEAETLTKKIQEYYQDLQIVNSYKQIHIIPINFSEESIEICHNTGDVYINTWLNSNYHNSLAQKYKKNILYLSKIDSIYIPNLLNNSTDYLERSPITLDIIKSMREISTEEKNKPKYITTDSKSIQDIIFK